MESEDCILEEELLIANDDDFICDFCSLEFPTSSERTEHILQHFQQSICSGCGDTLICIGDTWYGPHTDFNCCAANTDDAQIDNELMLPDFMEVKKEEIVDVEEQAEVVSVEEEEIYVHDEGSNDILEDDELNEKEPDETFTMIIPDEEAANVERYEASNNSSVDKTNVELATKIHNKCMDMNKGNQYKMTLIHHKNKCIGFKAVPNKKNPSTASVINGSEFMDSEPAHDSFAYIHGEEVVTSLTKEQLSNRQCPICGKIIVNRQNLICHMNIHSGRKPFICEVCEKSFAHIRNLIRHKEQQGHCDFEFRCTVRGCRRSFMSSNKLNRHVKMDHMVNSRQKYPVSVLHKCPYCNKGFESIGYLNMHIKKGHKTIQPVVQ